MGLERLKILPEVAKLVTELGLGSSLFYSKLQMPSSKAAYTSLMGWTDVVSAKSLQWLLLKQSDTFFFFKRKSFNTPSHLDSCPGVREYRVFVKL